MALASALRSAAEGAAEAGLALAQASAWGGLALGRADALAGLSPAVVACGRPIAALALGVARPNGSDRSDATRRSSLTAYRKHTACFPRKPRG